MALLLAFLFQRESPLDEQIIMEVLFCLTNFVFHYKQAEQERIQQSLKVSEEQIRNAIMKEREEAERRYITYILDPLDWYIKITQRGLYKLKKKQIG